MEETHRFTKGCLIKRSVSYVLLLKYWLSRNGVLWYARNAVGFGAKIS